MNDIPKKRHASQVIVIVTIVGVDQLAQAFYTFTDNNLSDVYVENRESKVYAVIPYHTIYALDYASSRNGWRFEDVIIHVEGPKTEHKLVNEEMAMITIHDDLELHRFKLEFKNLVTKRSFKDDPQEANIKPPTA